MLSAARKKQLGYSFRMRQFMDSFNAAGLVPASLLSMWELTCELPEDVRRVRRVALKDPPTQQSNCL